MTTLVDDCLLHIFEFLDPINLVSTAKVCKRWEELSKKKLNKVTEVRLNDPVDCYNQNSFIEKRLSSTNLETLKEVLEYLGPQLTSVKLGNCNYSAIFLGETEGYKIIDDCKPEDFITILSKYCTKIVDLQVGKSFIDLKPLSRTLFRSNTNLKKLILPDSALMSFPKCAFDSVEEVVWLVETLINITNFKLPFPNMSKLTLHLKTQVRQVELILNLILLRVKSIKSLTVVMWNSYLSINFFWLLPKIKSVTELEELEICNDGICKKIEQLTPIAIQKLMEHCPKLRVLKIRCFGFKQTDIASFLGFPKLEKLCISKARNFTLKGLHKIGSDQFTNLTTLAISFEFDKKLNVSGLNDAIERMPNLEKLVLQGLSAEQSVEFTCNVIKKELSLGKEIVIMANMKFDFDLRVYKDERAQLKTKMLKLWMSTQAEDYQERIRKFVESLEGCSVESCKVDESMTDGIFYDGWEIYHECTCLGSPDDEFGRFYD